jgi:hypothetical protein
MKPLPLVGMDVGGIVSGPRPCRNSLQIHSKYAG